MNKLNVIGIDTKHGLRTAELLHGDIVGIGPQTDILVVSAYAGSYYPLAGTVLHALDDAGVRVEDLRSEPELDLVKGLGVWVSRPLAHGPAVRILGLEIRGNGRPVEEALDNIFASLMVLDAKGIPVRSVAMPLLGTGSQRLEPVVVAKALLPRVKSYLERSPSTGCISFVEIDGSKAELISDAMDEVLGRVRVSLPQEELTRALCADVSDRLMRADDLFAGGGTLRSDWLDLLRGTQTRSVYFGVLSRKLVERILEQLGITSGNLVQRIRDLEQSSKVAPWICGYMNVLRHLGNEAAHEKQVDAGRIPNAITAPDLTAGLFCVERLLDFWIQRESSVKS